MLEKLPLRVEVLGLVLILMASGWQLIATDWWDGQLLEWEARIDREADQAVLTSIRYLADIIDANNPSDKKIGKDRLTSYISESQLKLVKEIQDRHYAMKRGQYPLFHSIRNWLFFVGSILAIGGRALEGVTSMSARRR